VTDVVTHHRPEDADRWKTTTFTDSVEAGIAEAKRIAGDAGDVTIASASIAAQALDLGLVDEVHPVVIQGTRATHLKYTVRPTAKDR
jgi:dihydrofolate reductase